MLVVDDVHWADAPSLRFLLFLARRLEGVPVLLVLGVRTGEPGADSPPLAQLATTPLTDVVRPASLSEGAVGRLIGDGLGPADPAFVAACRAGHGRHARSSSASWWTRWPPTASRRSPDPRGACSSSGPQTVAHATLMRLARLPGGRAAGDQGRGGPRAPPRASDLVARLAGLGDDQALAAVDALVAAHVLRPGHPLDFVHPIVRAAVYAQLPPGERSAAHARAADLLERMPARSPDAVATHVRLTLPAARPETVDRLREAARRALRRGAPEAAAGYLQRALDEGGEPRLRIELLQELARAETILRAPSAVEHLQEALALAADPGTRGRILADLAEIFFLAGQWRPAMDAIDSALARSTTATSRSRCACARCGPARPPIDPQLTARLDAALPELLELAERGGDAARSLNLTLAGRASVRGDDIGPVAALAARGLDGGRFIADDGLGERRGAAGHVRADLRRPPRRGRRRLRRPAARRAGPRIGRRVRVRRRAPRARAHPPRRPRRRRGGPPRGARRAPGARADVRAARSRCGTPTDAILERPSLADVAALAEGLQLPPGIDATVTGAWLLDLRGRLRLASRDVPGAVADLRSAGRTLTALGHRNPTYIRVALRTSPWRWRATRPRRRSRSPATSWPTPGASGSRAGSAWRCGPWGCSRATGTRSAEAVAVLEPSPARLEHARALVELGGALRRGNQRAAARDALRPVSTWPPAAAPTGWRSARDEELAAAGARASRQAVTGAASLTPSERRVAAMAASGMSSPEIAQALFVTVNTIETHLRHVYAKLGIHRRGQVAEALSS